jgi:hypothetical protein
MSRKILNETRACECGCGQTFECKVNSVRRFVISGHTGFLRKGKKHNKETKKIMSLKKMGHTYLRMEREARSCNCGCGEKFECKINSKQMFLRGHNSQGHICSKITKEKIGAKASERVMSGEYKFGRGKHGYFYSQKNNKTFWYRSTWELQAYQILEQMEVVKSYECECLRIPYEFEGSIHNYIPDILVTYNDNTQQLIEIKPNWELKKEKVIAKINAGINYAIEKSMKYVVWGEKALGL